MASAVLTPLVARLLRRYIKDSEEGSGSSLRVSWSSKGTFVLHNLELDLDRLLGGAGGFAVRRAYARRLEIAVPWAGLLSRPIKVRGPARAASTRGRARARAWIRPRDDFSEMARRCALLERARQIGEGTGAGRRLPPLPRGRMW